MTETTKPWPADRTERRPVAGLVASARNARLHSDDDVRAIADSMSRWGFTVPVLVDETGRIIAGHARVLAAKLLRFETIPVMVARGWTEEERRAYLLADNQLAARATWDPELLASELRDLKAADFDLGAVGFDPGDLIKLMSFSAGSGADPEATPDVPPMPVTRSGDVWLLAEHRVVCGDATEHASAAAAFGSMKPKLMVSDPPYGVEYDPAWRAVVAHGKGNHATGRVLNDDRADWREAWKHFAGDVAYVWHAGLWGGVVAESLAAAGFELRSQIIWSKRHFVLGRGNYHWQHEACFYAVRRDGDSGWVGDRKQSTVWEIENNSAVGANPKEKTWGHGTQKPVECMRRPIENNSSVGDVIYDPFLGSGTTLIAAEMSGRTCVGVELSPAYVDVVVQRWQEFAGREGVLESSGATFSEVSVGRAGSTGAVPARTRKDKKNVARPS